MKTTYNILIITLAVLLCSCNDSFLNRIPLDELTDKTYWQTEEHLILASNACINYLRKKEQIIDMELMGDNAYRERNASYKTIGSGHFTSDQGVINSEWAVRYDGIRRCNHFLENYNQATKVSEKIRERYAAEARFMRAYNYIYLVNFFGDVQLITKTLDISAPELYGKRTDKKILIDWIIGELEVAAENLPYAKDLSEKEFGRPTKEAAWAFCSRFALYHEKWDKSIESAQKVIEAGYHTLYTGNDPESAYGYIFTHAGRASRNKENKEFIVTRIYNVDGKTSHNLSREMQVPNEETRYAPTRSLMDSYLCNNLPITHPSSRYRENTHDAIFNNRDPRLSQTVLKPGAKWGGFPGQTIYKQPKFANTATSCRTPSGWYFSKFTEISFVGKYNKDDNDIPLMRYAEVLLNWIEAKLMRGDAISQQDIDYSINKLRARVGAPFMILAELSRYGLDLQTEIRRERRVELALEGERYFDILRWREGYRLGEDTKGIRKNTVPAEEYKYVKDIPTDEKGNLIIMTGRIFDENKHYLWPIPFIQTERNPNLLPNNPGW